MRYDNSFLFFFFSSRRRHTRCSRDWSSDVCSSDLVTFDGIGRATPIEGDGDTFGAGVRSARRGRRRMIHARRRVVTAAAALVGEGLARDGEELPGVAVRA